MIGTRYLSGDIEDKTHQSAVSYRYYYITVVCHRYKNFPNYKSHCRRTTFRGQHLGRHSLQLYSEFKPMTLLYHLRTLKSTPITEPTRSLRAMRRCGGMNEWQCPPYFTATDLLGFIGEGTWPASLLYVS